MNKIYQLPDEKNLVSNDKCGIYLFSYRFPTDYELGLTSDNQVDIENLRYIISKKITGYIQRLTNIHFSGHIYDKNSNHLRQLYYFDAIKKHVDFNQYIAPFFNNSATKEEITNLTTILRAFFDQSQPLYIGQTTKQSFRGRLLQHMGGETVFSQTIGALGFGWSEFNFRCFEFERDKIKNLEKMFHNIFKPIFSER